MKQVHVLLAAVLMSITAVAAEPQRFNNPVMGGDMADPSMIRVGDTYYAAATSSEWAPYYPVFTSKDMVNWEQAGHIFDEKPAWTSHSFWAPELFYRNNTMYCYYSARRKTDNTTYIGVATAPGTSLSFTDHGPIIELGSEAIDAFIIEAEENLYITWKAYGLDPRPIELLGSRLSEDGLRLEGEPFSLLKDDDEVGLEGQYHFKQGDYYYIIYSARSCCGPGSDYDVRVARSRQFRGPYEKYAGNPVLSGGEGEFLSVGHGTAVPISEGRYAYLSHAYLKGDGFYLGRQPVLHEFLVNDEQWVEFTTGRYAVREQPVPIEGAVQNRMPDFHDDFSAKKLKVDWTWNYPFAEIDATLAGGNLRLTGSPVGNHAAGTALCLRPTATDYSYETKIVNTNASFKGLTMYGDDQNLMVLGSMDNRIVVKSMENGSETILFSTEFESVSPSLKIEVARGRLLTFLFSKDGERWTRVNETPIDASFLVRWDRVARPGLIHMGDFNEPAVMDYFTLTNKPVDEGPLGFK